MTGCRRICSSSSSLSGPLLPEDAGVDGDLADVVERAAELKRLEPGAAPAEQPRERLGEGRHAGRVAAQVGIASLECGGEGGEE